MTNQELKEALLEHKAVNYGGIRYQVHGILYRAKGKQITVAAELLDQNGNCLVYAPPSKVEAAEE